MPLIYALIIVALMIYTWPWLLGVVALLIGLAVWLRPKKKQKKKKRKTTFGSLSGKTVAYVIIKDGHGKFGITTSRDGAECLSVIKRYSNHPIQILWTKTLPTRAAGYSFESWCKERIAITHGREWFNVRDAHTLARMAHSYWGSL
jgi:hypothetical protein